MSDSIRRSGMPPLPPTPSGTDGPQQGTGSAAKEKLSDADLIAGLEDGLFTGLAERKPKVKKGTGQNAPNAGPTGQKRENAFVSFFKGVGSAISSAAKALANMVSDLFSKAPQAQTVSFTGFTGASPLDATAAQAANTDLKNLLDNYQEGTFMRGSSAPEKSGGAVVRNVLDEGATILAAKEAIADDVKAMGKELKNVDMFQQTNIAMLSDKQIDQMFAGAQTLISTMVDTDPANPNSLLAQMPDELLDFFAERMEIIADSDLSDSDKAKAAHTMLANDIVLKGFNALFGLETANSGEAERPAMTLFSKVVQSTFNGATEFKQANGNQYAIDQMKVFIQANASAVEDFFVALGMPSEYRNDV